ncbi:hypothetical protein [Pseudomonas viridiflava]|uniref:hypothetical protein n=1 Tax=Pseudomonas viridiflava TaxID=33069 RepID=UPI000F0345C1|nr:hypothetical protein [Pseudomonas viridiflava]MBD8614867.1 hypothetical protein [Pseudomonas putida]
MNLGEELEKATGLMLERRFEQDPVGYITAMGLDDTRFARTMGFMIDRQSTILAEAITSYFQADPSLCALRKIAMAGALTGVWRHADNQNFHKDHPGVLDERFGVDSARYPNDSDEARGVRLFFREYLKLMPEARRLLSDNFVRYDPLHPSAQAPAMTLDDHGPMVPILGYLGYPLDKVAERITQVIDAQLAERNNGRRATSHVDVDINLLSWLQGTEHFDLSLFERATRDLSHSKFRQLPLLKLLIGGMKPESDPSVVQQALKNLKFLDFEVKGAASIGQVMVDFASVNLTENYGHLRALEQVLRTGLIPLDLIKPLILLEETVSHVVNHAGFDGKQLATLVAEDERLPLDRALADQWKKRAKPQDPEGAISESAFAEVRTLVRESFMPLDTAVRAALMLGHTQNVINAVMSDESLTSLLSKQALTEPLDTGRSPYRRILKTLCKRNDAAFSEQVFDRMLAAYREKDIAGAITLNEMTHKISASTLDRYVNEMPYTKEKFGSGGKTEPNVLANNFMLHVFDIVSRMPSVQYSTFDRLYDTAEVFWPELSDPSQEHHGKVNQLMMEFKARGDRTALCPVEDRVKLMEALTYLQKLMPFDFGDSPFINRAWERLIETFTLGPIDIATCLTYEEGILAARKVFAQQGQDKVFMQAAKPSGRDAMMAADLGL